MYPDQIYDLALRYQETKLWEVLHDSELFAVTLSSGQIGYCSVMGYLGEHIALALYIGARSLDSYRLVQKMDGREMSALKEQEWMMSQSCLRCAFECEENLSPRELAIIHRYSKSHRSVFRGANTFPRFLKYAPAHCPWPILEPEGIQLLCEVLTAALEVSAKLASNGKISLGFREGPAYDRVIPLLTPVDDGFEWSRHRLPPGLLVCYPEPKLQDELLLRRLKQTKKSTGAWICDVVMVPQPMAESDYDSGGAPRFPYMLLATDQIVPVIFFWKEVSSYEDGAQELVAALGNRMLEDGIPIQLQVVDQRTWALLKNFSVTLGIELVMLQESDFLDEAEESFFSFCGKQGQETIKELMEQMLEMFHSDDRMLLSMPKELLQQLRFMERQDLLPEEIAEKIRRL